MTNNTKKKWRKEGDFNKSTNKGREYRTKHEVTYYNDSTSPKIKYIYIKTFTDTKTIFWYIELNNESIKDELKKSFLGNSILKNERCGLGYPGRLEFTFEKEHVQAEFIELIDGFDALEDERDGLFKTFCNNLPMNTPKEGSEVPKWTKYGDFENMQYTQTSYYEKKINTKAKKEVTYKNIKTTLYLKASLDNDIIFWAIHFKNMADQQKFKENPPTGAHIIANNNNNQSPWIEIESDCFDLEMSIVASIHNIDSLSEKHTEILNIVRSFKIFREIKILATEGKHEEAYKKASENNKYDLEALERLILITRQINPFSPTHLLECCVPIIKKSPVAQGHIEFLLDELDKSPKQSNPQELKDNFSYIESLIRIGLSEEATRITATFFLARLFTSGLIEIKLKEPQLLSQNGNVSSPSFWNASNNNNNNNNQTNFFQENRTTQNLNNNNSSENSQQNTTAPTLGIQIVPGG